VEAALPRVRLAHGQLECRKGPVSLAASSRESRAHRVTPHRWSIWRPTLARKPAPGEEQGARSHYTGLPDAPEALLELLRPTHHQFYGAWRAIDVEDGLEKWTGYQGQSDRVG
jgi:hypothetical protein